MVELLSTAPEPPRQGGRRTPSFAERERARCSAGLVDPNESQALLRAAFAEADTFLNVGVPPRLARNAQQVMFAAARCGVIWHRCAAPWQPPMPQASPCVCLPAHAALAGGGTADSLWPWRLQVASPGDLANEHCRRVSDVCVSGGLSVLLLRLHPGGC